MGNALQQGIHYQIAGYDVYLGEISISIVLLAAIALLAIHCKRLLQWMQTIFGVLMLTGVLIITAAAFPHINFQTVFDSYGTAHPIQGVISIVLLAPWAFVGFEVVSLETVHFKFQVQKSKWLIGIAILIGGFMYISMSIIAASVIFALAQLIPYFSSIEAMDAESYLLLALWCLLGFLFYWRTMNQSSVLGAGSEHVTITALFSLLFYATVIWYIKMIMRAEESALRAASVQYAIVLFLIVSLGLCIMMLIHSHLRKKQLALERERIHAIEGSRAKSQFLFNMSHDIRTPMNAIMGFTHLGKKKGLSADEKDVYFEKIDHSGQQLLSIINDVLDMSRIENDRIELESAPTDLILVFEQMKDLFATQMEQNGIAFSVDSAGVEDQWVLCDKNRLNRVVLNLLSNACKFTPKGGPGVRYGERNGQGGRQGHVSNQGKRQRHRHEQGIRQEPVSAL